MRLSEERYDNPAYRDIKNSIDTAKEEGREEGRVEGIAKEKLATAKRLLGMGLTQEQVAKGTDLSHVVQERAEGPKAPSSGQRPGYNSNQQGAL